MALIDRLGLYSTIFTDPTRDSVISPDTSHWHRAYGCARALILDRPAVEDDFLSSKYYELRSTLIRHPEDAYMAWILAALVPCASASLPPITPKGGRAAPAYGASVAREGIKATNKVHSVVAGAFKHAEEVSAVKSSALVMRTLGGKGPRWKDDRSSLGMAIRRWGANWRSFVVYSLFLDMTADREAPSRGSLNTTGSAVTLRDYAALVECIRNLDLLEVYSCRPLMDGRQLATALDMKPGPWTRDALEVVMAWQLRNPDVQDTTAAVEEVKRHRDQLKLG